MFSNVYFSTRFGGNMVFALPFFLARFSFPSLSLPPSLDINTNINTWPTAGRQVGLDRGRRPGGRRNGGFGGQRPPTENLNDFHNDIPPAGEAGGKIINGFIMIDPITGR